MNTYPDEHNNDCGTNLPISYCLDDVFKFIGFIFWNTSHSEHYDARIMNKWPPTKTTQRTSAMGYEGPRESVAGEKKPV
jgi:hypothetical protein